MINWVSSRQVKNASTQRRGYGEQAIEVNRPYLFTIFFAARDDDFSSADLSRSGSRNASSSGYATNRTQALSKREGICSFNLRVLKSAA